MFSDKLYDHKFDIDTIIAALCGDNFSGKWVLNSRNGQLVAATEGHPLFAAEDGDDANHLHIIVPLPLTFKAEMANHFTLNNLQQPAQQQVRHILNTCTAMHQLPAFFAEGLAGGWLRERVKEAALDMLNMWGLIPPSMRHIQTGKVPITTDGISPVTYKKIEIV